MTDEWLRLFLEQQAGGFPDFRGARASLTLPVSDRLLSRLVMQRLPAELEWLQPLVDRLLAKEPAQRMQSGGELAEALADIEQRFTPTPARGTLPGFPPATPTLPLGPQEPTLGSVDATMVGAGRGPRRAASGSTSGRLRR